jgi:vancomycin resistance protein YoaR
MQYMQTVHQRQQSAQILWEKLRSPWNDGKKDTLEGQVETHRLSLGCYGRVTVHCVRCMHSPQTTVPSLGDAIEEVSKGCKDTTQRVHAARRANVKLGSQYYTNISCVELKR